MLYRFDITMEADLIEEIARIVGYEQISAASLGVFPAPPCKPEAHTGLRDLCQTLVHSGYHEVITYSFVSPKLQQWMDPEHPPIALSNPLSSDLSMMRTSLWPGLLQTLEYNINRQQECVRLFESGLAFVPQGEKLKQIKHLAGLVTGPAMSEQWSDEQRAVDLYDMKGEVEALFALTRSTDQFEFSPNSHPALHPGQTARITRAGHHLGWLGLLHPRLSNQLKCQTAIYLFELQVEPLLEGRLPRFESVSKFPFVRRDIAVVVDATISASALRQCVQKHAPEDLKRIEIFDVYQGKNIPSAKKSVGLGLTFQASSRTLSEVDIDTYMATVVAALMNILGGQLRE